MISWALSHTEATKADNRRADTSALGALGALPRLRAVTQPRPPQGAGGGPGRARATQPSRLPCSPSTVREQSQTQGRSSNWSERHVAYTSGLGTFSLCGGLITPLGQAVRLGSVVVQAQIPPTPRPTPAPFDYCLYFNGSGCTACVDRCPVGSMDGKVRDKTACAQHLEVTTAEFVQSEFGFKGYGCGLCQTGVPCESGIPGPKRTRRRPRRRTGLAELGLPDRRVFFEVGYALLVRRLQGLRRK